jgi:hypothetical protein
MKHTLLDIKHVNIETFFLKRNYSCLCEKPLSIVELLSTIKLVDSEGIRKVMKVFIQNEIIYFLFRLSIP